MNDPLYHRAAAAAAQVVNLGYLGPDESKTEQFSRIAALIYGVMKEAEQERTAELLKPSRN